MTVPLVGRAAAVNIVRSSIHRRTASLELRGSGFKFLRNLLSASLAAGS